MRKVNQVIKQQPVWGVASPVLVGHFEGNRKDQLLIGNKCYSFDDELVKYTSLEIKGTLPNNGSYAVIDVDGDKYDDIIVYDKKKEGGCGLCY